MASRYLNNITINDAYTFPSTDGTAGQVMTTDGGGNITFETIADGESVKVACKNTSGSTITKGTPVYITGTVGSSYVIEIAGADASNISKMPAVGLLETDLANNGEGYVITGGVLKNLTTDPIDSSTPSSNDTIYVKSGGGLTLTKPSGTNYIQNIGKVGRVNSSNAGSIVVSSIMRTNDVPAPLFVDVANQKVGIGDSTPTVSLDISATDAVQMPSGTTAQRPSSPAAGMFRYNTTDGKFEGYTTEWGEIGGGGSATLAVDQQTFDGDGSTVAFTLSTTCESENNLQVYIDGVYQSKDNFSVSGTTLTFSTAPATGTSNIEVIHITSMAGSVEVDTFTGDGSDTTFDLSTNISAENNTQVFLDGVYQSKGNYSISGTTITFSTAPANGVAIEVVHFLPSGDFTIGAVDSGDDAIIRLSGTNGFTDDVKLVAGSNITITPSGDDITIASTASGGISWQSTAKTSAFTAVAGEGYFVNTTSAAITVTLPSSPSAGDELTIVDYAGTADTNNITITSSNNINGSSDDAVINYERGGVSMVYVDATQGWIAYNAVNETDTSLAPPPFSVDYLVVAGGGGGGNYGAGGGAGGLRTSYGSTSGGGASAETSLSLSVATNYTITVGAGGSGGGTTYGTGGSQGANSEISGAGITTITSVGGGGGEGASTSGSSGGSGGGRFFQQTPGYSGTTNQGYAGSIGGYAYQASGSGGGASEAGNAMVTDYVNGDGGDGLSVTILNATNAASLSVGEVSGSDVYYAGGAGGGTNSSSSGDRGDGGLGGGGAGAFSSNTANIATSGTANTGGGGGGGNAYGDNQTGKDGGSGVVILRYPNTYTVTIGSGLTGTTSTDGSDKVTVFTAGTGTISFS